MVLISALGMEAAAQIYASMSKAILLVLLSAASIWMNRRECKPPPLVQCGFLARYYRETLKS